MDISPEQFNELIEALKSIKDILWWIAFWMFIKII